MDFTTALANLVTSKIEGIKRPDWQFHLTYNGTTLAQSDGDDPLLQIADMLADDWQEVTVPKEMQRAEIKFVWDNMERVFVPTMLDGRALPLNGKFFVEWEVQK